MDTQWLIALCAALTAAAAVVCVILLSRVLTVVERQAGFTARQMREACRPVLLCTGIRQLDDTRRIATIANQGSGVALNIMWSDDDREPGEGHRVNGPSLVLGPGGTIDLTFDAPRTTRLIFVYASTAEERARTEVLVIADLWTNRYFAEPGKTN